MDKKEWQAWEDKRALEDTNWLKQALKNSDSMIKHTFKEFCYGMSIVTSATNWGFIPPKEDVQVIKDALNRSLESRGIDIKTIESIPTTVMKEIAQDAKEALAEKQLERINQQAKQDLDTLLTYGKPIIAIDSLSLSQPGGEWLNANDPESIIKDIQYRKPNTELIGHSIDMYAQFQPMHMYSGGFYNPSWGTSIPIQVQDFVQLNKISYAIVTDNAVFVHHWDKDYMQCLANGYREVLAEQGIKYPQVSGLEGFKAMMSHVTQPEHTIGDVLRENYTEEEKYQILAEYIAAAQEQYDYGTYYLPHPNSSFLFSNGSASMKECTIQNVLPGMEIKEYYTSFQEMATGDKISSDISFTVFDSVNIGGDTILLTDKGILASRDLSQELALERSQDHEITIGDNN